MLLERTISQLAVGPIPADEARQMGQLGYMQWIAGLARDADYQHAAIKAHTLATPFAVSSPAVAEFCELLLTSLREPLKPLPLSMPPRRRRGGAGARRSCRMKQARQHASLCSPFQTVLDALLTGTDLNFRKSGRERRSSP